MCGNSNKHRMRSGRAGTFLRSFTKPSKMLEHPREKRRGKQPRILRLPKRYRARFLPNEKILKRRITIRSISKNKIETAEGKPSPSEKTNLVFVICQRKFMIFLHLLLWYR